MFNLTPTYSDDSRASRAKWIRQEFARTGGYTLRSFAEHLIDDYDVYGSEFEREAKVEKVCREARQALRARDDAGLPFAGPTATESPDGAPIWATRQAWLFEDYCRTYALYGKAEHEFHELKEKLADECVQRYGRLPGRSRRASQPQ